MLPAPPRQVTSAGQDKTYKDVIEPLESVSLSIAPTQRAKLEDAGSPEDVAKALTSAAGTPQARPKPGGPEPAAREAVREAPCDPPPARTDCGGQVPVQLIASSQRADEAGHVYYSFEFTSGAPGGRNTRHAISTIAVTNGAGAGAAAQAGAPPSPLCSYSPVAVPPAGKAFTFTVGASEKRWAKLQESLRVRCPRSHQSTVWSSLASLCCACTRTPRRRPRARSRSWATNPAMSARLRWLLDEQPA